MSASASQRAKPASSDSAREDKGDSDSDYCVTPPKKRSNTGRWVRNSFFVSHPREQEVAVGVECSVEYLPSNYDYYELTYEIQQELKSDSDECLKRRKACIIWFVFNHMWGTCIGLICTLLCLVSLNGTRLCASLD